MGTLVGEINWVWVWRWPLRREEDCESMNSKGYLVVIKISLGISV
jgi:hypothetical protein